MYITDKKERVRYVYECRIMVDEKLIRGDVRTPEGDGPFPTVCFYHGFCVDRIGIMRLHELFARKCVENGIACVKFDFYGCGESDGDFSEMRYLDGLSRQRQFIIGQKNRAGVIRIIFIR